MTESNDIADEAERLRAFLSSPSVHPAVMETRLKEFDDAAKNELVARIARTFNPPPPGRLLTRLLFIRTPENEADMTTLYIANLRSPSVSARAASLNGLNELKHPLAYDFAVSALRDDEDPVLFAACNILLPKAQDDPNVRRILQEVRAQHAGDAKFHLTTSLLASHGIL